MRGQASVTPALFAASKIHCYQCGGGVYYAPTYIVDYIVEQTVGKLLEGKQPHAHSN